MQDMIKRIIEMDKEARRLNDEALQRRADAAQAAAAKRSEVYDNYLLMARNRVETIRKVEMQSVGEQLRAIDDRSAAVSARLQEQLRANRQSWVEQIVAAVTEGDDLK